MARPRKNRPCSITPKKPQPPTPRQVEVLIARLDGLTHAQVATRLGFTSLRTSEGHISAVIKRTDCESELHVIGRCLREGWLVYPPMPPLT